MMNGLHLTGLNGWRGAVAFDVFGVGTAVSGVANAASTIYAANAQADASNHAADLVQSRYQTTRSDLSPYVGAGYDATNNARLQLDNYTDEGDKYVTLMDNNTPTNTMNGLSGSVPTAQDNSTVPVSMSQSELEATPGYQFTRDQGLQGVASSAAARGLGVSGAALKGAAKFATGLADSTYQTQFSIKQQQFADQLSKDNQNFGQGQTQFSDKYNLANTGFNQDQGRFTDYQNTGQFSQNSKTSALNRLTAVANLGESAAAQTGAAGSQAASAAGNYLTQGANNAANTLTNGAGNVTSGLNNYLNGSQQNSLLSKYLGGSGSSSNYGGNGSATGYSGDSMYNSGSGKSYGTYNDETGY